MKNQLLCKSYGKLTTYAYISPIGEITWVNQKEKATPLTTEDAEFTKKELAEKYPNFKFKVNPTHFSY